jgi:CheY-like chemotaxis protein
MNILVVEDTPKHQESARQLLCDHNVDIVTAFDYAMDKLGGTRGEPETKYDAVLSDLLMPQGRGDVQGEKWMASEQMAFGFPIALIAAQKGIPYVAIVSDMNHHKHPMAYTLDFLNKRMQIDGTRFQTFGESSLSRAYPMTDGTISLECPYELPQDQRQGYVTVGSGFKSVKNWKGVLERIMRD